MTDGALLAIRPLQPRDREAWERLWLSYLAFYGTSVPREVTDATWERLVFDGESPFGLIALDVGGRGVGIAHYLFHVTTWHVGPACHLEDLFVAPDSRGGGIGRALIEAVYEAAERRGADEVYWLTQDFNVTARRLYDKLAEKTPFIKYRRPMP